MSSFSKYFLKALIATLIANALIGIYVLLVGEFGKLESKVLFTTLAVGWFSMTALCSSVLKDRKGMHRLAYLGMAISAIGFVVTVLGLWSDEFMKELWQAVMTFIIASISMSHISLMLLLKPKTKAVQRLLYSTIFFITVVALMCIKSALNEFSEDEFYFRLLGVFGILDALGTLVTPIANRMAN